jgi:hypothetical protein
MRKRTVGFGSKILDTKIAAHRLTNNVLPELSDFALRNQTYATISFTDTGD